MARFFLKTYMNHCPKCRTIKIKKCCNNAISKNLEKVAFYFKITSEPISLTALCSDVNVEQPKSFTFFEGNDFSIYIY